MIKKIISDRFFSASVWMFSSMGLLSIGNYLYHVLMARMLTGKSELGALESVISLLYILGIPLVTFGLVLVKFISQYKGEENTEAIAGIYFYFRAQFIKYGALATFILILVSPIIRSYLHLPSLALTILLAISFFVGLFSALYKAILQGMSKFDNLTIANIIETTSKLIFAVTLVSIGLRTEGAFASIALSSIVAIAVALSFLKKIKLPAQPNYSIDKREIFKYAIPVFVTTLGTSSLFTADIILVRHFFAGVQSDYYSALSIIGKIIFFAVSPLTMVMFPLVSEYHSAGKRYIHYLYINLGLTFLGGLVILSVYFLFPKFVILALPGSRYLPAASNVGVFGIFMVLYSLCSVMLNFYLSIHKTIPAYLVSIGAILQIILISWFHSSLREVITMNIIISGLLLMVLLLYYPIQRSVSYEKK